MRVVNCLTKASVIDFKNPIELEKVTILCLYYFYLFIF